jgi:transcriptional regulator with XRE-family HTH domain
VDSLLADGRTQQDNRFAEIVSYAQVVLGGQASGRASQRELAEALGVAPTMITRYKSKNCDWRGLKASTLEALAKAARLEVGTLFVWINEGQGAAMAYERRMSAEPKAFRPVDLARELTAMLESQEQAKQEPAPEGPDYAGIQNQLQPLQGPAFDRLVALFDATAAVAAAMEQQPLSDDDWLKLARLVDADPARFRQLHSGQSASRTPQQAV